METKVCSNCGEEKSVNEFYKHKRNRDGLACHCKKCRNEQHKEWAKNNPEKVKGYKKKWRDKNPNYSNEYQKKRKTYDLAFRIWCNLKNRHWDAFQGIDIFEPMRELVGCSPEELVEHLEKQFKDGMARENYADHWEVDHIIPFSAFDLTDPEQRKEACCHTNIQPLTLFKNRSKSDKILD